jgi:alkanesulfonate monooxygenase SsuD/methylene tetrahydromethanopterin reductase-like flavin-dependent oxidoreductase (luciferase family)
LSLGLGAGWNDVEFAPSAPVRPPHLALRGGVHRGPTLLAEGAIDFDGTYVQARDAELLPRPARPGGPRC